MAPSAAGQMGAFTAFKLFTVLAQGHEISTNRSHLAQLPQHRDRKPKMPNVLCFTLLSHTALVSSSTALRKP